MMSICSTSFMIETFYLIQELDVGWKLLLFPLVDLQHELFGPYLFEEKQQGYRPNYLCNFQNVDCIKFMLTTIPLKSYCIPASVFAHLWTEWALKISQGRMCLFECWNIFLQLHKRVACIFCIHPSKLQIICIFWWSIHVLDVHSLAQPLHLSEKKVEKKDVDVEVEGLMN